MAGTVYTCNDVPAPADPTTCTSWTAEAYTPSPFHLELADAQSIGTAIAVLWAAAWCVRQLARFLREF